jgi:hypothetical protein
MGIEGGGYKERKILKGKDLVDYIVDNNLLDKDLYVLVRSADSTGVYASEVQNVEYSNNEDDGVFIEY